MKLLNLIVSITFLTLSLICGASALILKRIDLGGLSCICGAISYVAYKDFENPEQI
jgi:hypothetical protein